MTGVSNQIRPVHTINNSQSLETTNKPSQQLGSGSGSAAPRDMKIVMSRPQSGSPARKVHQNKKPSDNDTVGMMPSAVQLTPKRSPSRSPGYLYMQPRIEDYNESSLVGISKDPISKSTEIMILQKNSTQPDVSKEGTSQRDSTPFNTQQIRHIYAEDGEPVQTLREVLLSH